VLAVDQLIFDWEGGLLENVYNNQRKPVQKSLSFQGLKQVLGDHLC